MIHGRKEGKKRSKQDGKKEGRRVCNEGIVTHTADI